MLLPVFLSAPLRQAQALSSEQEQLLRSSWFLGAMAGFFLTGSAADAIGRRPLLQLCATVRCFSTLSLGLMPSFKLVLVSRLISSIGASGAFNTLLPLLFEFSPPANRSTCKQYLSLLWNVGVTYLCIGAWVLRKLPWRWLSLLFLPSLPITLMLFSDVMESPKYLLSKGKVKESKAVLRQVARFNGVENDLDVDLLSSVNRSHSTKLSISTFISNYVTLFRPKNIKNTCLLVMLNFAVTSTYYGLTLGDVSKEHIIGNIYQQQILASALEVPGLIFIVPLADSFGRRKTMISILVTYAASMMALAVTPPTHQTLRLVGYLLARMAGQAAYALKWIINAESYPTSCRNAGLSLASIVGQIGGLVGPLLFFRSSSPFRWLCIILIVAAMVSNPLDTTRFYYGIYCL